MGNFNKHNKPNDRRGGGGFDRGGSTRGGFDKKKSFGGDRDRSTRPKEMFSATCADCGKHCEVPFRPTGKHPVFCSDCFASQRGDTRPVFPQKRFEGNMSRGANSYDRPQKKSYETPRVAGITKEQFDSLSAKLDKIVSLLIAGQGAPPAPKKVTAEKKKENVVKKEKKTEKKVVKKKAAVKKKTTAKKVKK